MSLIGDLIDRIRSGTQVPRFYQRIPRDHVLDRGVTSEVIEPRKSYFEVRLSEMFLHDKREYWVKFIPFAIAVTEFLCNDDTLSVHRESVPFMVNNQLLGSKEQYVENNQVEYRNTRVAGPVPYLGDDIVLFVALYRAKVGDLSEKLFGFLGNLVGFFDVGCFSTYLEIGRQVKEGLSGVLNIEKALQYRLGQHDTFTDKPDDPSEFRECYLAYINCPEKAIKTDELWVKDHRLRVGSREANEPFRDYDYCLVRIDRRTTRNYEALPFHKLWKQVEDLVGQGRHDEADALFNYLAREVARSPDLTKTHRFEVQLGYAADKETVIQQYNKLRAPGTLAPTRGPRTGLSARAVFQKTADLAEKAGISKGVARSLLDISEHWDRIPYLKEPGEGFKLTDDILNEQVRVLSSITQIGDEDPEDLAKAFAVATISAR